MPVIRGAHDPALLLWQEWKAAALETQALCRKQQRLETQLVRAVEFPRTDIDLAENGEKVTVYSFEEIDELFGFDPEAAEMRAEAEDRFAAHQARWDAADQELGYSAAKREEEKAADRQQDMLDRLMATQATSLAGVAGKLDAVLLEGEPSEECIEFPWPQMRSALCDLVKIGRTMQPGMTFPGADRKQPYPRQRREDTWMSVFMHQRDDWEA